MKRKFICQYVNCLYFMKLFNNLAGDDIYQKITKFKISDCL